MSLEQKQRPGNKSDLVKLAAEQKAEQIANGTYVAPFVEGTIIDRGTEVVENNGLLATTEAKLKAKETKPQA